MSSVREIAKHLNVSPATVSRVLNNYENVEEQTRRRVLDRINELGYFPSVGRRNSNVVALAYPDDPVQTEYGSFESALLTGIMRGLEEHQFDLKLLSIRRDKGPKETYSQFFLRKGVRGVILRCFRQNRPMILRIAAEKFPSVIVAEHFDEPEVNYIRTVSYASSRRAVEHLIGLGHRRIVLAVHSVIDSDHADRRRAYCDALHCAGIVIDHSLIVEHPASFTAGEQVMDAILAMPDRPTAVFATNPMTALGIMRRAQEREVHVPRDLSVVGMDDSDVRSHVWPRLTSVCQNATMLGYESALWLSRTLSARALIKDTCRRELHATFEVNGTTAQSPTAPPVRTPLSVVSEFSPALADPLPAAGITPQSSGEHPDRPSRPKPSALSGKKSRQEDP